MASFFDFARSRGAPPRGAARRVDRATVDERSPAELAALISGEVIPRMVALSRPSAAVIDLAAQNPRISTGDIEDILPLVLALEAEQLSERIERLLARGVSTETLLIDLIAPIARRLGTLWEEDRCDFIEVTMGVWRLQELVHELGARRLRETTDGTEGRRALFATMPGDHHGLGTVLIAEVFAGRGWHADRLSDVGVSDISRCLASDHYDLVGLTVSGDCHMAPLPSVIRALRSVSINPRLIILVGGHAIGGDNARALAAGADGAALDAGQAAELAARLVDAALAPRARG